MSWGERFIESLDRNLGIVFREVGHMLAATLAFVTSPDTWSWVAIGLGSLLLWILFAKMSSGETRG